jgi:tetratricopeptide (TPR) repeat protein
MDATQVFEVTSGNPFLVVEVLASGDGGGVPYSVAEAVRGRLSNLSEATGEVVEQLAVIPSAAEQWLVEAVVPGGVATLADAEQRGVLTVAPTKVAFPHELARRAIMDSLPAARRIAYNQAVLAALLDHHDVDVSRIVHHGAEAGAGGVIIEYGPAAARAAAAAGAHREAVAYYRLVLDHLSAFEPRERVDLVEAYAIECYTTGLLERAVPAQEDVVRRRREQGDPRALGLSLRWLSRMCWWTGARAAAETNGAAAVAVLESAGDEQALALALSNQSQLHMLAGRNSDAIPLAQRAASMARALGDAGLLSHALNDLGTSIWWSRGRTYLEESLQVALAAGETEPACRAYVNLATLLMDDLRLDEAERILEAGIELADDADFLGFVRYLRVNRSTVHLMRGRWDRADSDAESLLEAEPIVRCHALVVLGRVRVRCGRDGGDELLEQAWMAAQQLAEPQRICPAAAALLELAWLQDDLPRAASAMADAYQQVRGFGRPPGLDEFEYWLDAAGLAVQVPVAESGGEPFRPPACPAGRAAHPPRRAPRSPPRSHSIPPAQADRVAARRAGDGGGRSAGRDVRRPGLIVADAGLRPHEE